MSDTEPLKGVLLGSTYAKTVSEMQLAYTQALVADLPKSINQTPLQYAENIKTVDKKKVTDRFQQIQSRLPADLISRAIARMCSSPEAFLVARSTFARSYSMLSMCMYILGIGDRHLENYLVRTKHTHAHTHMLINKQVWQAAIDCFSPWCSLSLSLSLLFLQLSTSNCELIGIDFGAAFGNGVLLSVPELMPFRFTRQFQNMLAPLQTEEILKRDMTYVMTALREERRKLLTVMDVFIRGELHPPTSDSSHRHF